jgi:hypothetical protein
MQVLGDLAFPSVYLAAVSADARNLFPAERLQSFEPLQTRNEVWNTAENSDDQRGAKANLPDRRRGDARTTLELGNGGPSP